VHEGPQRISRLSEVPLEPGMILSNEPGYYREGAFGIRLENLIVVRSPRASAHRRRPGSTPRRGLSERDGGQLQSACDGEGGTMADHIKIRRTAGTWTIRAGGAVLGESTSALELTEGAYPFVIYFPRDDIAMPFLDRTEKTSTCPWKGEASYYSIVTKSTTLRNAAWSYENPKPGMEAIREHLAFYATDDVTIERI
jgi:uncharacterized protein (DUF427 family)